jgi:hypothetical protein
MTKKKRIEVFEKFNGLCAYTGKPLNDGWQVDHAMSKYQHTQNAYYSCGSVEEVNVKLKEVDNIENLFPALKIVNHYKRSLDIEGFRRYMSNFHLRLAKLPKKTLVERTKKRIEYMNNVASAFDITLDKPFSGKFYFETINSSK